MSDLGKQMACFKSFTDEKWTEQDKLQAICAITRFATINAVTKEELLRALKWLFEMCCDVEEEEEAI